MSGKKRGKRRKKGEIRESVGGGIRSRRQFPLQSNLYVMHSFFEWEKKKGKKREKKKGEGTDDRARVPLPIGAFADDPDLITEEKKKREKGGHQFEPDANSAPRCAASQGGFQIT